MKHRITVRPCILGRGLTKARCSCGEQIAWGWPRGMAIHAGVNHLYAKITQERERQA
jgi:hypothetical protein